MASRIILNLIEISIGILVGFFTYKLSFDNNKIIVGILSIIVGLLSSILASILINGHDQSRKIESLEEKFNGILQLFSAGLETKEHVHELLKHGKIVYKRKDTDKIWLEILWRINRRYWTTSYSSPAEVWKTKLFQSALAIQSTKIKVHNVDIKRIYIIENENELENLKNELKEQIESGIKIRYILKNKLNNEPLLKSKLLRLETYDFGLCDSTLIWNLYLNKDRKIRNGEIIVDNKKCLEYEEFYKLLFEAAENYKIKID